MGSGLAFDIATMSNARPDPNKFTLTQRYLQLPGYRPIAISTPDAIARTAIAVPIPEKPKLIIGNSPVKISQMANNNIPIFFVIFINRLP